MPESHEVVITGIGVACPIGIGREQFWESLAAGRSGVRPLSSIGGAKLPVTFGGEVVDFDPKQYVTPRKSLKVMSRDIQLGFTASQLACEDARLGDGSIDPDRFGVVLGADMIYCDPAELADAFLGCQTDGRFDISAWGERALPRMFPLWMLKYLPNMPACHIAIARDARGPNNSITLGEVSSLVAMAEAVRVIERGQADAIVTGGCGSRVHLTVLVFRDHVDLSHRASDPAAACRPFDAERDGMVFGEGAAAIVLERRAFAEARGATILGRVLGYGMAFEPRANGSALTGRAIGQSIRGALRDARLAPDEVGHVNAHGASLTLHDKLEARAIREVLGDVPVTAPKSFFGNLGAATGAVEALASIMAFEQGRIPFTLNYEQPDPECPINVVRGEMAPLGVPTALLLNMATTGQAAAVAIAAP